MMVAAPNLRFFGFSEMILISFTTPDVSTSIEASANPLSKSVVASPGLGVSPELMAGQSLTQT